MSAWCLRIHRTTCHDNASEHRPPGYLVDQYRARVLCWRHWARVRGVAITTTARCVWLISWHLISLSIREAAFPTYPFISRGV